jgi:hypothetical protein
LKSGEEKEKTYQDEKGSKKQIQRTLMKFDRQHGKNRTDEYKKESPEYKNPGNSYHGT